MEEVLDSLFKQWGLDKRRKEMRIINGWEEIVGVTIARATTKINIFNKTLFLNIDSSLIRNELLMIKTGLINKVNTISGFELINDIVIK